MSRIEESKSRSMLNTSKLNVACDERPSFETCAHRNSRSRELPSPKGEGFGLRLKPVIVDLAVD